MKHGRLAPDRFIRDLRCSLGIRWQVKVTQHRHDSARMIAEHAFLTALTETARKNETRVEYEMLVSKESWLEDTV